MSKRSRRRTALFPGAFRPPHVNHYAAVAALVADRDIDDVTVIVTNRTRLVPGTTNALDVDLAMAVWKLYLRDLPSVSVVRAKSSAVREAYDLVSRHGKDRDFVLVVGKKDYGGGSGRFSKLFEQPMSGRSVEIAPAVDNVMPVSSSQLRQLLADGSGGREAFEAALPRHLTAAERLQVWKLCRESMVDQAAVVSGRITQLLEQFGDFATASLHAVDPGHQHGALRVRRLDGTLAIVKCANDAVAHDGENPLKCRRRLKAEVSATKWVRRHVASGVRVPVTEHYDRVSRTLVQSAVCVPGTTMLEEISVGQFSKAHMMAVGDFLGAAHTTRPVPPPFWDDPARDHDQWITVVDHQLGQACRWLEATAHDLAGQLVARSKDAVQHGFFHLDFTPANVRSKGHALGVVDFERSSTVGDRAFDLGTFLGWLLWAGHESHRVLEALFAVHTVERAYERRVGTIAASTVSRAAGFAAMAMVTARPAPSDLVRRRAVALLRTALDGRAPTVGHVATEVCVSEGGNAPRSGASGDRRPVVRQHLTSAAGSVRAAVVASSPADSTAVVVTLEIEGFDARSMLDVVADGVPVDRVDVDASGQAFSAFETSSTDVAVEIRHLGVVLLSGVLSETTR